MSDHALDAFDALLEHDAHALDDRAPCGYLTTRPDGVIVKTNTTFLTLTGYTAEDLVGARTFASLLSPGGRMYHETHYAPMLQLQDRVREIALELVAADGTRVPVLVNSVLERDAVGTPVVIRTAVFDATERRAYERELLAAKERAQAAEAHASLVARTLQLTLMPHAPPEVPHLDVAAAYRPAGAGDEIGGDFYDVFEVAPDDWIVVVGDVCGKGVDAATVAAEVRYSVRSAAVRHPEPAELLAVLNEVLLRSDSDRFCTAVVVRLRRGYDRWALTLSVGGHPAPLHAAPGRTPSAVEAGGPLLGVFDDAAFTETVLHPVPGETLLLFTDGVTEGRRGTEFYGDDRLATTVEESVNGSATDLVRAVTSDVVAFQGGRPRDDIVVVALRA